MLSTQQYIQSVSPGASKGAERVLQFAHDHPILLKITRIALDAIGAFALVQAVLTQAIFIGIVGLITIVVTEYVCRNLALYGATSHSMSHHAFKPAQCEGGRLFYQGDVPVLSLETDDPYEAGKAHGYLLAPQAIELFTRAQRQMGLPDPESVSETLQTMRERMPASYLEELQGMVDGANQWIDKQWFFNKYPKVTLDQLMLANLVPDQLYFRFPASSACQREIPQVGCTVAIGKNRRSGLVFGRNMDWPSFGLAGTYSLVIHRKSGKYQTAEIGVPGFLGTLTGMNEKGFSVAMNVCGRGHANPDGIPASIYNRMVLENCGSVRDAGWFVWGNQPLGSYHLSVADQSHARSYHFYQGKGESHVTRDLKRGEPLITTNCSYGQGGSRYAHMHSSQERREVLDTFFDGAKREISAGEKDLERLIAHSLTLPPVNNIITTHTVEMVPERRVMRAAFDNSYSASQPMRDIDLEALFT